MARGVLARVYSAIHKYEVLRIAAVILLIVLLLAPLAIIEGSISVVGRTAVFSADVYSYGIKYSAAVKSANISRSGEAYYYRGLRGGFGGEGFGEAVGILKDSKREYSYYLEADNLMGSYAKVYVNTTVSTIPWLPYGMAENCKISIEVVAMRGISKIMLKSVSVVLWRDFDENFRQYREKAVVWSVAPGMNLSLGEKISFGSKVRISRSMGDRIGLIGVAEIEIYDDSGVLIKARKNIPENAPPPIDINIYPLSLGQTLSIMMIPLYLPLATAAAILILCTVFIDPGAKKRPLLLVSAAFIIVVGILGLGMGLRTLAGLLGIAESVNFTAYYFMSAIPAVLLIVHVIIAHYKA